MIKLIVSDLDDTLIHKADHLDAGTINLVKKVEDAGVAFTFATGRMPYRAENFAKDIDLEIPFVANNGSILYCKGEIVFSKMLEAGILRELLRRYMAKNPEFTVIFSYEDCERPMKITHWIQDRLHKYPGYDAPLGDTDASWDQKVHKIYVVDEYRTGDIGRLAKELSAMTAHLSYYPYGSFSMEIIAEGCSKATGVQRLLELLKYKREEVMAIGDHTNDIEVLQLAGLGIAVGNAVPELKAVANHITKAEREQGVKEAIQEFVLQGGN